MHFLKEITMTFHVLRRGLSAGVLAVFMLGSVGAWALPAPKDIEVAVQAGHFGQAESMLQEVLRDKPGSAKAHYELGQVLAREGRYVAAREQLLEAKKLEPTLKFASSPAQFDDVLNKVTRSISNGVAAAHAPSPSSVVAPSGSAAPAFSAPEASPSRLLPYALLGIGGLFALGWWLRRSGSAGGANSAIPGRYDPAYSPVPAGGAGTGFGSPQGPAYGQSYGPSYGPGYGPPPAASSGMGSTVTGAVVGGLAGVAAGYALSRALEGGHNTVASAPARPVWADQLGPDASNARAVADTPDFGTFDAGAGGGWDDGGGADLGGGSGSDDW
jgi:hypothetical protein